MASDLGQVHLIFRLLKKDPSGVALNLELGDAASYLTARGFRELGLRGNLEKESNTRG